MKKVKTTSNKNIRIIYFVSTGLLTALMLFSAGMEFFNHEEMVKEFVKLGYPPYIIYPLGVAKILGLIAILTKKSQTLKEWAYAGFFFDVLLAAAAHLYIGDGDFGGAVLGMLLILTSYFSEKKFNNHNREA
ncbi:DoxX family protein [Ascidiimonas sp. W6]|uniref:DoxX family protein n=1 Tax=Ascidiimonas meishanensis TaxID=3128903 RepID=UPI0030ED5D8B